MFDTFKRILFGDKKLTQYSSQGSDRELSGTFADVINRQRNAGEIARYEGKLAKEGALANVASALAGQRGLSSGTKRLALLNQGAGLQSKALQAQTLGAMQEQREGLALQGQLASALASQRLGYDKLNAGIEQAQQQANAARDAALLGAIGSGLGAFADYKTATDVARIKKGSLD